MKTIIRSVRKLRTVSFAGRKSRFRAGIEGNYNRGFFDGWHLGQK